MTINKILKKLKEQIEKNESLDPKRKKQKDKMIKEFNKYCKEFEHLSSNIPTTNDQFQIISSLQNIIKSFSKIKR
jgi:Skp family chaperone for outer membrane proteins